jgi:hypothetical protein
MTTSCCPTKRTTINQSIGGWIDGAMKQRMPLWVCPPPWNEWWVLGVDVSTVSFVLLMAETGRSWHGGEDVGSVINNGDRQNQKLARRCRLAISVNTPNTANLLMANKGQSGAGVLGAGVGGVGIVINNGDWQNQKFDCEKLENHQTSLFLCCLAIEWYSQWSQCSIRTHFRYYILRVLF